MRVGWRAPVLGVVVAGAFVAGGQLVSAQSPPAQEPIALCEAVTTADVRAALGVSVRQTDAGTACVYTAVTPEGQVTAVSVGRGAPEVTRETFADGMAGYAQTMDQPLEAVAAGDEAWATVGDSLSQVSGRVGDRFLTIVLVDDHRSPSQKLSLLSALARAGMGRL